MSNSFYHKELTDAQWNSIYHKFRCWCSLGLFERVLQLVNGDAKGAATLFEVDSTFCKVHQSACSALKETKGSVKQIV